MPQTDPIQGFDGLPLFTDPPNIPDDLKALYDFLVSRSVMRFDTTTARDAALPSPPDGTTVWVDADGVYYGRAGGQWRLLWAADEWTNLPLASGMTALDANSTPQYRVSLVDQTVYVRGTVAGTIASGTTLATLPAAALPGKYIRAVTASSGGSQRLNVSNSTGTIQAGGTATWQSVDFSYRLG